MPHTSLGGRRDKENDTVSENLIIQPRYVDLLLSNCGRDLFGWSNCSCHESEFVGHLSSPVVDIRGLFAANCAVVCVMFVSYS